MVLNGRTSKGSSGGANRTLPAQQTLERLRPLLGRFGITRIANVTGLDVVGIPTVIATRPNARSLSVSQGKGPDLDSAKVSAVMESIEQWHAERIDRSLRLGSLVDVAETCAVADTHRLPNLGQQYDGTTPILWIAGEDLASGDAVLVPYEMVHLDLRLPFPAGSGFFLKGSNGLASGNCLIEAIAHGLCEVVEHDATTLFCMLPWDLQWDRRINLKTVTDPLCISLLDAYDHAELDVAVWETTSDVAIPSYLCSVVDREANLFRPVGLARGSGCHWDAAVALSRALTEAAQSRLTRIVGTRDDIQLEHFAALQMEARLADARRQIAAPATPPRSFASSSLPLATFEHDVRSTCERLLELGMPQVIAVDISRPGLPVSVVRVVVPGLEGCSEVSGYAPGERALRLRTEMEP
jgi:YcaO-like protein with predicted kinase domain